MKKAKDLSIAQINREKNHRSLFAADLNPALLSTAIKIVFERLEDPESSNGNYNIFIVNSDGTQEARLTNTN